MGCGEDGEVRGGPGGAVVVRGGEGEGRSADEAGESPEEPCAAAGLGLEFGVVPDDGCGEAGVGEDGERFGHVPVFGAGAAAEDHHGLVGVVFAVGRVVEGGEEVAVGENLDRGVVIVDAEAGSEAETPADGGHALAGEVGEELVGAVEGLLRVGVVDRVWRARVCR